MTNWSGCSQTCSSAEFIYEQPAVGDIEYTFKHALTQEVAYNSVLIERRRSLHERTARRSNRCIADQLDDHFAISRIITPQRQSAQGESQYLRLAGEQAVSDRANAEAVARMEPALDLLQKLPDDDRARRAGVGLSGSRAAMHYAAIKGWEFARAGAVVFARGGALSSDPGSPGKNSFALQAVLFVVIEPSRRAQGVRNGEPAAWPAQRKMDCGTYRRYRGPLALSVMYSGDFEAPPNFGASRSSRNPLSEPTTLCFAAPRQRVKPLAPGDSCRRCFGVEHLVSRLPGSRIGASKARDRYCEQIRIKVVLELVLNLAKYPFALRRDFSAHERSDRSGAGTIDREWHRYSQGVVRDVARMG